MPLSKTADRYRGRARRSRQQLELECTRAAAPIPDAVQAGGSLDDFFRWAEATLTVPTGLRQGSPFVIYPWQRDFLAAALAPGIREAGLSVARKNGKSGLVSALILGYLIGPLRTSRWRGICVSLTGVLAGELRRQVEEIADASGLSSAITVQRAPPPGTIKGLDRSELTLLASDKASGHAVGADLALIDEAGLLGESRRELWNAVLSSVSGRDGRLLCFSIRGHSPMFSELAARHADPSVHWTEYAAADDMLIDELEAWESANPGLGTLKSDAYMEDTARRALASPADAAAFRAYDLNQPGQPSRDLICDPADWIECVVEELPARDGQCVLGFDAGGSASMTCAVALWPRTGRVESWAALPAVPDLIERGRKDSVGSLYEQMQERSELVTYPGRVTPVSTFISEVADALGDETVLAMGSDRVRRAEVEQIMAGAELNWPVELRGTGAHAFADGSHDIRAFQRMVLTKRLKVKESLLWASAIRESVLRYDSSGNPALDKARARARIDVCQAA